MREEFVRRGLVSLQVRHFPILGPESVLAAVAAECAADQGRFWPFYDLLFQRQRGRNQGTFSPRNLKAWAQEVGLEGPRFDACLDAQETLPRGHQHVEEGRRLGVRATPTLLLDGLKVEGAIPWDRLRPLVEEALRRKGLLP